MLSIQNCAEIKKIFAQIKSAFIMTQIICKLAKLNCIELWKQLDFLRIFLYLYYFYIIFKITIFLSS